MTRRPEEPPRPLLNGGAETPNDQATARLLLRLPAVREDQVARERIWRALGQADRRPRREWRPFGALAVGSGVAIVALALAFGAVAKRPPPAILELAAGSVLLAAPEADWIGGQAGATLPAESRVRTDAVSRAVISLERSALIAEPATDVGLEALGRDTLLRLSGGTLLAEVDPLRAKESFVVLTTRYRVTVKGTIFLVRERTPDDVEVSVSRGRVEVAGAGGVWSVVAGQLWSSRHPSVLGEDSITEAQRQLLDEAIHPGPRSPIEVVGDNLVVSAGALQLGPTPVSWNAPLGSTELRGQGPAGEAVGVGVASADRLTRVVLAAIAPAVPADSQPAATALSAEAEAAEARPVRAPKLLARRDSSVARVPVAAMLAVASAPPPPRSPLEQALDLVRSHRYPEAEGALEALSSGGGSGADIALYELANLRQRQLGDVAGALDALQRYRTIYPQGALVQEAEISMIELELASPDPSAALPQIDQFLSTYPDSERAPEVYWLRGNLLQASRDFAGALQSYRHVQGGAREEEALYFRAVCQERLGQTDAAAETLRAYLERFPSASHAADAKRALAGR